MKATIWKSLTLLCLMTAAAQGVEYGDLVGEILYDGEAPKPVALTITKDQEFCGKHNLVDESLVVDPDTKGIANVAIWVQSKVNEKDIHPEVLVELAEKVKYDNQNCRFEPHVMGIWFSKQTLELHNSDTVGHNSNLAPLGDKPINPLLAPNASVDHKFGRKQNAPTPVSCNIHPWMKGYVVVSDNPYIAVTGPDGKFKLANLPVGKHKFAVWQEKCGWVDTKQWPKGKFELEIKPGENNLSQIKIDAKLFKK